jgi:serine/threonine protein kinase/tetratricopeptide (TPR) repeat protein
MLPQRWDEVKQKLQTALELPIEQRPAFLNAIGEADPELRHEIEGLLASHDAAGAEFLKTRAPNLLAAVSVESNPMVGQTLGPYEIRELIGAGGMGEVYRAHDPRLGRDVAIKVLPLLLAADPDRQRRFEQEARAAAALNHPNILAIHDLGCSGNTHYVVTELLEGETLRVRLRRGALSVNQAVRILLQIAQGLAAAHAKGIIHRDLKPENIFITSDGNTKILDFGLAKLLAPTSDIKQPVSRVDETVTGLVMGTPGYMSPEQVRGQAVDQRTDIFALGAMAYEMLSGRRAFRGDSSADTISAILSHAPPALSGPQSPVPTGLDRIVQRCLEKSQGDRFQSVREFSSALEAISESGSIPLPAPPQPKSRPWLWACAIVAIAAGLMLGAYRTFLRQPRPVGTSAPAVKARKSVAVLGFKDLSGRPESKWLSPALAEMLTTELSAGQALRTVPGENVARVKNDLSVNESDSLAKDTLVRLRQNLGNDFVVLGSYVDLGKESGGQIRVDLRVQDAASGETLASFAENGTESGLLDLVARAGRELRRQLGAGDLPSNEEAQVKASLPTNPEAARSYAEGLARMRAFDDLGARDFLQRAVAAEPNFAPAHAALAQVWSSLGYDAKSMQEAKQAFELSNNLPREQHLSIEGRYYESQKDWAKAVDVYHALWEFSPDNLEYGLRLAAAQTSGGQAKNALETVAALRSLPAPASGDPRIDFAESLAAHGLSDFKRELAINRAAEQKGEASGARLLVARAKLGEARSLFSLGDSKSSQLAAEQAQLLFAQAGDRNGQATALHNIASAISEQGDNAGAMKLHEQALAICTSIGNRRCMSDALNSIGVIHKDEADFPAAQKAYEESLALRREIDDRGGEAVLLNNLGVLLYQQGKNAAARTLYEQALGISRQIGEKRGIVRALTNLGIVLKDQGELAESRKAQEESLTIRRGIGDKVGIGIALNNLAELLLIEGDLVGAEKAVNEQADLEQQAGHQRGIAYARFVQGKILLAEGKLAEARKAQEEALAIRTKMNEKTTSEDSRVALGEISIEEGHPAEAEGPAREVRDQARAGKESEEEIGAELVLARSLLAQGKAGDAVAEVTTAEALANASEDRLQRIEVGVISASIRATSAHASSDQIKRLENLLSQASKYGCIECEFEAQLALGEIEARAGHTRARAVLSRLESAAKAHGFLLIASKAHASLAALHA